jgi:hypothetical protein
MSGVLPEIDAKLERWLLRQPMFFVATAPLAADGHVNVSPKGMAGTFAVLGPLRVAYLDYFGSGVETISHLRENGRIVLMFNAFDGPPKIVRLHGRGHVTVEGDTEFAQLRAHFDKRRTHGQRSIIVIDIERVSDSCGYSVPRMDFVEDRTILDLHQLKRPATYYEQYWDDRNAVSIDGLPSH